MEPVVITGIGVVSPLGNSLAELTRRFAAGAHTPVAVDDEQVLAAAIPADKRARIGRLDRLCRFFLAATYRAVGAAGLTITPESAERTGISFGTGLGCYQVDADYNRKVLEHGPATASPRLFAYTVSSAAAGEVSIAFGITGPNVTAHMGFAAGLGAVGYGFDLIQMGKADVVLAGGADVVGPALLEALSDMQLLRTAGTAPGRPGVVPAEAAAVAVLERRDRAQARGARCWGRIDGYAAGFETSLTTAQPQTGGIAAAMPRAIDMSGLAAVDVGLVMSSAHGTAVDQVERAALTHALSANAAALVVSPKNVLGETFGASGAVALALGLGLMQDRPPLAEGLGSAVTGATLSGATAASGLHHARVVMVNSLCYSGNIVSLLATCEA